MKNRAKKLLLFLIVVRRRELSRPPSAMITEATAPLTPERGGPDRPYARVSRRVIRPHDGWAS